MKLIFLDFDGVWIIHKKINPDCAKNLKQLIEENDLHVVITSNWRMDKDKDKAKKYVSKYIIEERVLGSTIISTSRASEINSFLTENEVENYVIVDDHFIDGFETHSVITDPNVGFNRTDYEKACEIIRTVGGEK